MLAKIEGFIVLYVWEHVFCGLVDASLIRNGSSCATVMRQDFVNLYI
jgi:hypothetical protein